jgi:transcriptional regulator of acetoin/glycerol metabolism
MGPDKGMSMTRLQAFPATAQARLLRARRLLHAGDPMPAGLVADPLAASWQRAREAGLQPTDHALFHHTVAQAEQRRVADTHKAWIESAQPELEGLWRALRSPSWIVLLTNAEGTIVRSWGEHTQAPRELRLPLQCGRRLLEAELGTNAPSLALHEDEAVLVRRDEHFLDELGRFSCVAAPVRRPDGTLAGVIDITGFDADLDLRMARRVCAAARSIEHRLFEQAAQSPGMLLLQLHEDPRFLGTPAAGLLLARDDGRVLSLDRNAQSMLDPERIEQVPCGRASLHTFFCAMAAQRLLGHRFDSAPIEAELLDGSFLHARAAIPLRRPTPPRRAATADAGCASKPASQAARAPVGEGPLQAALERTGRVFPLGVPVLLLGETGTGKEWFARQLHERHRPGRPFVAVDCSSLTESLAEAQLFGHVEGAYTGSRKGGAPGQLELADGGTLLLDEIGDMPLALQTRLLRVLQERRLSRLGAEREIALDLRVVAATHRDLSAMVAAGRFREDLYFRLRGLTLRLPALRERSDLEALIAACLEEFAHGDAPSRLTAQARARLLRHAWPGNLRELRQVLQVASALAGPDGWIDLGELPDEWRDSSAAPALPDDLRAAQRQHITRVLAELGGNVSAAARKLGISRTTLYARVRSGAA